MPVADQIAVFLATNAGLFDEVAEDKIGQAQSVVIQTLQHQFMGVVAAVSRREKLSDDSRDKMLSAFQKALRTDKGLSAI